MPLPRGPHHPAHHHPSSSRHSRNSVSWWQFATRQLALADDWSRHCRFPLLSCSVISLSCTQLLLKIWLTKRANFIPVCRLFDSLTRRPWLKGLIGKNQNKIAEEKTRPETIANQIKDVKKCSLLFANCPRTPPRIILWLAIKFADGSVGLVYYNQLLSVRGPCWRSKQ